MNIPELFKKMKSIQINLINFIENDDDMEEKYQNLTVKIKDEQIFKDRDKFKLFIQLLSNVIKNHNRANNFLAKIQKILIFIKDEIKQTFSNYEIFDFFKNNKIILLFLIKENIITIDKRIVDIITTDKFKLRKYPEYFYKEIKPFIGNDMNEIIVADDYENNRKKGENENYLCQLIREDSIDQFITYVNRNDLYLQKQIKMSIYETNSYLLKKDPTLIEYSAFFGSVSIFKYLYFNKANIGPNLWLYSIHGNNPELISFLENNKIIPNDETYQKCLEESIKCHHIDMSNYIIENFIKEENLNKFNSNIYSYAFHYHNYLYLPTDPNYNFIFFYACQYNYVNIVDYFLQNKLIDIHKPINITFVIIHQI